MDLKERILEAVIEEFNEKGIKFTMEDVARRLGISKRTLYETVKEKEALFIEAVDYVFSAIKESENKIAQDTSLDIVEKLKRILIVLPEKYKTIDFRKLYDVKRKYPKIFAQIEKRLESQWDVTFTVMEQAMEEGRIKRISLPVFQAIFSGTIEYYLSRSVLMDSQMSYEDALGQMLDIIINGIVIVDQ
jgi:AcrR family transcriptional regulator